MRNLDTDKLWSLKCEAGVIGSMLLDSKCIDVILPIVFDREMFFKPEHRIAYDNLISLYVTHTPIDMVTFYAHLEAAGELEAAGGVDYLSKILRAVPSTANAEYYAKVVLDKFRYREMVRAIEEIDKIPFTNLTTDEQIDKIKQLSLNINQSTNDKEYNTFKDFLETPKSKGITYPMSLRCVNGIIKGYSQGELIVIAGRPGMGKTGLCLQDAITLAKQGMKVVYFTLEMSFYGLWERANRSHSEEKLRGLDLIVHSRANTPDKQLAFVKATHGVDVVFVDYLQLMSSDRKNENRVQEITTISRRLKRMAIEFNIPVIALSQLNRQLEHRENHTPRLSDLRESGSIEQDADIVLLLHREDYYRQRDGVGDLDGNADIIIAKSRNTDTGRLEAVWVKEKVQFADNGEYYA